MKILVNPCCLVLLIYVSFFLPLTFMRIYNLFLVSFRPTIICVRCMIWCDVFVGREELHREPHGLVYLSGADSIISRRITSDCVFVVWLVMTFFVARSYPCCVLRIQLASFPCRITRICCCWVYVWRFYRSPIMIPGCFVMLFWAYQLAYFTPVLLPRSRLIRPTWIMIIYSTVTLFANGRFVTCLCLSLPQHSLKDKSCSGILNYSSLEYFHFGNS